MEQIGLYQTKQKNLILQVIKDNSDRGLTTDFILSILNKDQENVSKATLYRVLDKLVALNEVRKYYNPEKVRYEYQYARKNNDCDHHLHLRCRECGNLIHLDCDDAKMFISHIEEKHGFKVDNLNTVIVGVCEKCQKEGKR